MKFFLFKSIFFFFLLSIELEAQTNFTKLVKRYNKLDEKSIVFKNISKKNQLKLSNDEAKLRADIKKLMNADNSGTGTVDCINQCQTEYDICCNNNSGFLCGLQSIKCLLNCAGSSEVKALAIKNSHEQLLK